MWKLQVESHFRGLPKIAEGHDPHRNRPTAFFALPDTDSHVGVSDGVDAWVSPVGGSCCTGYGVDVHAALKRHKQERIVSVKRVRVEVSAKASPSRRIYVFR